MRSGGRSNEVNLTLKTIESTLKTIELTLKTVELTLKTVESTLETVESTLETVKARVHLGKSVDNYGPQLSNLIGVSAHFAHKRATVFATAFAFSLSERRKQAQRYQLRCKLLAIRSISSLACTPFAFAS